MTGKSIHATGIAWFRPEDYDRCRQLFVDGHKPSTTSSLPRAISSSGLTSIQRPFRPGAPHTAWTSMPRHAYGSPVGSLT